MRAAVRRFVRSDACTPQVRSFGCCAVPLQKVSELRKCTGASIQKCKEALEKTSSDIQAAIEFLRKRGENINCSKAGTALGGARISASVSPDGTRAVLSKTTSQTDFASESELFVKFSEAVNASLLTSSNQTIENLVLASGFSPQVHSQNIHDVLSELSGILTEPVAIPTFEIVEGDVVAVYIHNKSQYSRHVGSTVSAVSLRAPTVTTDQRQALTRLADKISRQVLATSPKYIEAANIPESLVQKEREVLATRVKNPEMLEKAFKGHMQRVYSEQCLMDMEWIIPVEGMEGESKTVRQIIAMELAKASIDASSFKVKRFVVLK